MGKVFHSSEEVIREHAQRGGFPANSVVPIGGVLNPEKGR